MVAYWRLKTKENFKLLTLKVVAVAYKRFKYSDLTWNETFGILENWSQWRGGRLRVVVATGGSTPFTEILLNQSKTGTLPVRDELEMYPKRYGENLKVSLVTDVFFYPMDSCNFAQAPSVSVLHLIN